MSSHISVLEYHRFCSKHATNQSLLTAYIKYFLGDISEQPPAELKKFIAWVREQKIEDEYTTGRMFEVYFGIFEDYDCDNYHLTTEAGIELFARLVDVLDNYKLADAVLQRTSGNLKEKLLAINNMDVSQNIFEAFVKSILDKYAADNMLAPAFRVLVDSPRAPILKWVDENIDIATDAVAKYVDTARSLMYIIEHILHVDGYDRILMPKIISLGDKALIHDLAKIRFLQ